MGMQAIPTGVYGPLPKGTVGLLLGRSSVTMKGLIVAPRVIDSDYTGEIKIMARAINIVTVNTGQRIAQLILLPMVIQGKVKKENRGTGGFGSSDAYWVQPVSAARPELELSIEGKTFKGILDTGADVSVIAMKYWPQNWPLQEAMSQLQGIGQTASPNISARLLSWKDKEGHKGEFQPYVLPELPVNLWGRDVMEKMGVYLHTDHPAVIRQLMNQGLTPNQGLGKESQGIVSPLSIDQKQDRAGLGYF